MQSPPLHRLGLAAIALAAAFAAALVPAAPAPAAPRAAIPCRPAVSHGVLPPWARTGFSEAKPRVTHVLGRSGHILAILFVPPLHAPPATDRNNKILWVPREEFDFGDMRIRAQRMQGTAAVGKPIARRVPGGPGPSTIDLPVAGCWRFTLTWTTEGVTSGGHGPLSDVLDLRYVRPAGA